MQKVLKNPVYIIFALGIFTIFFSISMYALLSLPGHRDAACVHRAYFTPFNVIYSFSLSWMISFFFVGYAELRRTEVLIQKPKLLSFSGIATILGILTTFCTACTISLAVPFLAGLLGVFTTFNIWFKLIAFLSLSYALYLLHQQLNGECKVCKV